MSCTPSPDTATKKSRRSQCCVDNPVDQFINKPVVTVPATSGTADIPAAMQPWEYCGYGPTGGCGMPSNWKEFCGQVYDGLNADAAIPCGTISGPSIVGRNVFTANHAYKAARQCQYPGWKAVVAKPVWPGMFGYVQHPSCCPGVSTDHKYLSQSKNFQINLSHSLAKSSYDPDGGNTGFVASSGGSANVTASFNGAVDTFGNSNYTAITKSDHKQTDTTTYDAGTTNVTTYDLNDQCGTDAFYTGALANLTSSSSQGMLYAVWGFDNIDFLQNELDISINCGIIRISRGSTTYFNGTPDALNAAGLLKVNVNSHSESYGGQTGVYKYTVTQATLKVIAFTDDHILLRGNGGVQLEYSLTRDSDGKKLVDLTESFGWDFTYDMALGSPLSFQAVVGDGNGLLNAWNLGDDEQYPWRQDSENWILPLVTRDAAEAAPDGPMPPCTQAWSVTTTTGTDGSISTTSNVGNRDPQQRVFSSNKYTGQIIGAPQPVGYGRYFNFRQRVVCISCPSGTTFSDANWFCTSGWGQLSYSPLPKTATNWTDGFNGSYLPTGAYILQAAGGSIYVAKYAETLMPWPSINFGRPFGRDRFLIDFSDPTLTTDPACTGTAGIAVASYTSDIVTDHASFLYAHRKFPNCRPIGSTINVTGAVDNGDGTVTITTDEAHWLCGSGDGHGYTDQIDFYGVDGLGSAVTVQTSTPGTLTFVVNGALTGAYGGGGYIATAGMNEDVAKWDWTCSRHQFSVQTWKQNATSHNYAESSVTLIPKSGFSVLICSPNNDTFPDSSAVYNAPWFDLPFEACNDANAWHCKFLQAVPDPFYIEPVKCSGDSSSANFCSSAFCAGGSCQSYALVEPVTQMPPGAPQAAIAITFSHDSGVPLNGMHTCSYPDSQTPTLAMFNATYLACAEPGWREATHHKCPGNSNALPNASGYVAPTDGITSPDKQSNSGAGSTQGGAGESQPGAGLSGGGL